MSLFPKCFFFHNWTKWERKVKKYHRSVGGIWQKGPDGKILVHEDGYLERTCQDCGVLERRKIDTTDE